MEELWRLLREALPEAIGALISTFVLVMVGKIYTDIGIRRTAILIVMVVLVGISLIYTGVSVGTAVLIVGSVIGTLGCAYLAFRLEPPRKYRRRKKKLTRQQWLCNHLRWRSWAICGKGPWKHLRWRPWALIGLVIIPLLAVVGVGHLERPPSEIIILVANFDGPDPQKYRVTETVTNRLRLALESYNNVKVASLERVITEADGSVIARAEGEKHKAAIVIWGWYGPAAEAVSLSVHFEVLHPSEYLPEFGLEAQGKVQIVSIKELESFTLQTHLSNEMAYLSFITLGVARFAVDDWDGATAHFSDALNQKTDRVPPLDKALVYIYRGTAYLFKGEYDRAIADFDQALQLEPGNSEPYNNRGLAYVANGNYDQAITDYNQAILIQPDVAAPYNNRGFVYLSKGEYDRAIADFDQALQLEPDFAPLYSNRGFAYDYKGEYDLAIADYDRALQLRPDFAEAYNNRGFAFGAKGEYDLAISNYNQAIKTRPGYAKYYLNRGVVYAKKGEVYKATNDFKKALKLSNDPIVQKLAEEWLKGLEVK